MAAPTKLIATIAARGRLETQKLCGGPPHAIIIRFNRPTSANCSALGKVKRRKARIFNLKQEKKKDFHVCERDETTHETIKLDSDCMILKFLLLITFWDFALLVFMASLGHSLI